MPLSEPLALAIVRARDRARDALRELRMRFLQAEYSGAAEAIREIMIRLRGFPALQHADRVVAKSATASAKSAKSTVGNMPMPR